MVRQAHHERASGALHDFEKALAAHRSVLHLGVKGGVKTSCSPVQQANCAMSGTLTIAGSRIRVPNSGANINRPRGSDLSEIQFMSASKVGQGSDALGSTLRALELIHERNQGFHAFSWERIVY
jgi:hypothetical protein